MDAMQTELARKQASKRGVIGLEFDEAALLPPMAEGDRNKCIETFYQKVHLIPPNNKNET